MVNGKWVEVGGSGLMVRGGDGDGGKRSRSGGEAEDQTMSVCGP